MENYKDSSIIFIFIEYFHILGTKYIMPIK
jgi:hypothetical protein